MRDQLSAAFARIEFVGLQEHYEESMLLATLIFGWPPVFLRLCFCPADRKELSASAISGLKYTGNQNHSRNLKLDNTIMVMFNWRQKLIKWLQAAEVKTPVDRNGKPPINLPYVFIIGFNKTATTTLHHFFQANDFPGIHWDNNRLAATMLTNCIHDRPILSGYDENYRVFSDMILQTLRLRFEANSLFRILDADYPGSYFIFNNRPTEAWLVSRWKKPCAMYNTTNVELEMRFLNTNDPKKALDKWKHEKEVFEREVREYFSGNERFLEFDISDPAAPQKISALLAMELDVTHWGHHKTNMGSEESLRRVKALGPCPLAGI